MHVGQPQNQRIDFGSADRCAVQGDVGVNVDPACVETQRAGVADLVVNAQLGGKAPRAVERDCAQRRGLVKERSVVQAETGKGTPWAFDREVIVQRQGRRQVFDRCRDAHTRQRDIMFKRGGCQQLDPDVVRNEVFGGQRQLGVVIDGRGKASQRPVVGFRVHVADPDAQEPIPLRLRQGRTSQRTQRGSRSDKYGMTSFHVFHPLCDAPFYRDAAQKVLDLGQYFEAPRCGILAATTVGESGR